MRSTTKPWPVVKQRQSKFFRVPSRVTNQWVARTAQQVSDEHCRTPATVTEVVPMGKWTKLDHYGAKCRDYCVTFTFNDGRTCKKNVEVTRGAGMHRFHLQFGVFQEATR